MSSPVVSMDLQGQTYDQVDHAIKEWCGLPAGIEWDKVYVKRSLHGTVPRSKTVAIEEAILLGEALRHNTSVITEVDERKEFLKRDTFKYFRNSTNLQILFQTDKAMWCHRFEGSLIFTTGAYEDYNQERNLKLFQKLADVWSNGRVLSVHKGYETEMVSNDGRYPFVRPFAAVLAVDL